MKSPTLTLRTAALCGVLLLSVLTVGGTNAEPLASDDGYATGSAAVRFQQEPVFAPMVFRDIAGQVATEDGEVAVRGVAPGYGEVLVMLIDRRGQIASQIVSVSDDDVFEEDVALVTADGTPLDEGQITANVFAPGRDGVVGDGEIDGVARTDLEAFDESAREKSRQRLANRPVSRTQQQVLELVYEESINDSGSDDQVLVDVFTFTNGQTAIEAVVPQSSANATGTAPVAVGETMVVRGRTNRKPDDNTVFVEVTEGPTPEAFDFASTDEWGTDGVWSVEIEVPPDTEPGTYTVESTDGDDTDSFEVVIQLEREDADTDELMMVIGT